ncbi:MAG: YgjV family protein [Clostridia bacterium]|nr:YgjV family protein [Clostridia bacterium]
MYNYTVSLLAGLVAIIFVIASYLVTKKSRFLTCQTLAILFLSVSYLFVEQYFAMVGMAFSVVRTIVYFVLETKNKAPNFWLKTLFALLSVFAYVVINLVILKNARYIDLLFLSANVMYSYLFGIRDLKLLRYLMLVPTAVTSIYNVIAPASLFVIISYIFEFFANVVGIIKARIEEKKEQIIPFNKKKEQKV